MHANRLDSHALEGYGDVGRRMWAHHSCGFAEGVVVEGIHLQ